jgi:hypothetical protein
MEKLIEALQQNFEKYNRNLPQYDAENATMEKEEE